MNCNQAQKLLPLHAGFDLDEKRAQQVDAHLQSCAACAHVAAEYRESVQLTQQFAAPAFSEAVYAGLRRRVLHEIETKPEKVPLAQLVFGALNLRARMTWAVATVLLIAFTVFGFYLIRQRQSGREQYAVTPAAVNGDRENRPSVVPVPDHAKAAPKADERKTKAAAPRRRSLNNNRPLLAVIAPETHKLPNVPPTAHDPAPDTKQTLRVEMQTQNPNIRIIWFSHPETRRANSNSKGI